MRGGTGPTPGSCCATGRGIRPLAGRRAAGNRCPAPRIPCPPSPGEDVNRFVEQMVVDRVAPDRAAGRRSIRWTPDARVARLVALRGRRETSRPRCELVYRRDGVEVVVEPRRVPTGPGTAGSGGSGGIWGGSGPRPRGSRRTSARIRCSSGRPAPSAGSPTCCPGLARRWEVHGDDRLLRFTVRGAVTPTRPVLGGRGLVRPRRRLRPRRTSRSRRREVLEGWLRGERYLRLDDGSLAELPLPVARAAPPRQSTAWPRSGGRSGSSGAGTRGCASNLLEEVGDRRRPLARLGPRAPEPRRDGPPSATARAAGVAPSLPAARVRLAVLPPGSRAPRAARRRDGPREDRPGPRRPPRRPAGRPALVVAPTSVLHGWVDEAARFAPELRAVAWHGPGPAPGTSIARIWWSPPTRCSAGTRICSPRGSGRGRCSTRGRTSRTR